MNYKQLHHNTITYSVKMHPYTWLMSMEGLLFPAYNDAIFNEYGDKIKEPARLHEAVSYTLEPFGSVEVEAFIKNSDTRSTINGSIDFILDNSGVGMIQSFVITYGRVYTQEGETHILLTRITGTGLCDDGDVTTRIITEHRHIVKEEPLDEAPNRM